jgi:acetoacetyl-CoA reductase
MTTETNTRLALVTGGTGGIGAAICVRLADAGHRVVTNYRNEEKAQRQGEFALQANYKTIKQI